MLTPEIYSTIVIAIVWTISYIVIAIVGLFTQMWMHSFSMTQIITQQPVDAIAIVE